jgi:diacylglycerol O-acyltransferase / wax synthase
MQQLTAHDASFIYMETPNAHMAGSGLYIYDQSTAPGGMVTFTGILDYLEERLERAPRFRQRLVRVPMDMDHPYWVDDPDFDLEFHVRHIALPKPGDWRQLCIQVARLQTRPLDMNRPLWELYVIEGLDNVEGFPKGSFAVLLKNHHASADGVSGVQMMSAIHDDVANPAPIPKAQSWHAAPLPTSFDLIARAQFNNFARQMQFPDLWRQAAPAMQRQTHLFQRHRVRASSDGRAALQVGRRQGHAIVGAGGDDERCVPGHRGRGHAPVSDGARRAADRSVGGHGAGVHA